jgi:transposase
MEACCGAHHLGRLFAASGHEVRLTPPEYVRPYVKAPKNDDLDAKAIAEAATRSTMRFVEVKSQAQSDLQALHRARERLVSERTTVIPNFFRIVFFSPCCVLYAAVRLTLSLLR